jgi:helicase
MKMRSLEEYGIPSYIIDIWEKNYSPFLLPIQEEAVRYYGILDYEEGKIHPHPTLSPQGRGDNGGAIDSRFLLTLSPTSSGKTFIGEMAAITQAIHYQKAIYLAPLRSLAEEKYRHFKKLYSGKDCPIKILISSRDHREDDHKIIAGEYEIAIMVYEKFNYFLLKYPSLLENISLIIVDELQMIHDPERGPLLEEMIKYIRKNNSQIKLIGLSAYLENEAGFLNWLPAHHLLSFVRPVELRKGILREGTFRYITHNKGEYGEEEFFKVQENQDYSYEDCLKNTISYFIQNNEPTLLFFPTRKETRKWAAWLAEEIDASRAEEAITELSRMEETRSRDELLYLLEKGMAYHNADLSWEERNLIESYLKKGEIKIICATTTLSMGINLPFKNVILSRDRYVSDHGNNKSSYRTSLSLADVENMGGRAGRLDWGKEEFGRAIFLADSLFAETILQNIFFKFMKEDSQRHREMISEEGGLYLPALKSGRQPLYRPVKKEKDFTTFLLKAIVDGENSKAKLKGYLTGVTTNFKGSSSYWLFDFAQKDEDLEKEIDLALEKLLEYQLITAGLSPTEEGILICAKGIDMETYLFFRNYLENKAGKMSHLELITLMALSREGKRSYLPFPQFNHKTNRYNFNDWKYQYYNQIGELIADQEEEYKEIYQDILGRDKEKISLADQDYLSIKKAVLLYDWIGEKEIRELEEGHKIYGGSIQKLGEEFSWLADSLRTAAESLGWKMDEPSQKNNPLSQEEKTKKDNWEKIKILAERLNWGVEEEGLKLARLHIPGLSRSYIKALLKEGFDNEECMAEISVEELTKVLPQRLAQRIKNRINTEDPDFKLGSEIQEPITANCPPAPGISFPPPRMGRIEVGVLPNTNDQQLTTILEIDTHRPDRIIFKGKEIKITTRGFSLLYLLAQHKGEVVSYDSILDSLWKDDEEAVYTRINYHICKIKKDILKIMDKKEDCSKKIENIFKTIPGRGLMLDIKEKELETNL